MILDHIRSSARRVDSSVTITGLFDSDDAPFAEAAAVSGAPLVTRNDRHFPADKVGGIVVETPRAFLTNQTARSIDIVITTTLNQRLSQG